MAVDDHTSLLPGGNYKINGFAKAGTPVIVTYAFAGVDDLFRRDLELSDNSLRNAFREATEKMEDVAGVTFVEVERGADEMLTIGYTTRRDGVSYAYFPYSDRDDPDTQGFLAMNEQSLGDYVYGSGWFQVLLHELGHAVGLKHPHEKPNKLVASLDNTANTVMSYVWVGSEKTRFQELDRAALRELYGPANGLNGVKTSWDAKNDVLTITGTRRDDELLGVNDASDITGRGGSDYIATRADDDTLRGAKGFDTMLGSAGDDSLFGGAQADRLIGGADDDTIFGGTGNDEIYGDIVRRNAQTPAGNDELHGGDGRDELFGGAGDDRLYGGNGNDTLNAGSGSDTLAGGPGNDLLIGGGKGDIFVIAPGGGEDSITDFGPLDRLDISAFGFTEVEAMERIVNGNQDAMFAADGTVVRVQLPFNEELRADDLIL